MSVNWEDEIPDSVLNEIYDRIAYNQSVVDQATTSSVVIPSTKKTWYSDEFLEKCLSQTLKKYWGYESFRPNQLEVCKCLVKDSRDCFMMMGTGSGKSLVFQLPAIALREQGRKCCTIIISPLISLIEDQVSALLSMNIAACAIGSNCDKKIEDAAMLGFYSLIYATPEKILLWSRGLEKLKSNCEIISIAIDESHCVSEWGSDFRPEYSTLKNLRNWLGNEIPIVALTASATKEVQNEIIRNLSLRDPLVIRDSVNRPNLKYIIRKKCMKTEIIRCILDYRDYQIREFDGNINDFTLAPTLIYVNSKKLTEEIAHELVACQNLKGIRAAFYHSGLSPTDRAAVHRAFLCDDIQVVVATTAFGMGINKPDIRLIIHYGLPLSIESYYQQTGRAGRDGLPSRCVLFWSENDLTSCINLISKQSNNPLVNSNQGVNISDANNPHPIFKGSNSSSSVLNQTSFTDHADHDNQLDPESQNPAPAPFKRLMSMSKFVRVSHVSSSTSSFVKQYCRRKMILDYFQENYEIPPDDQLTKSCCDLCDSRFNELQQLQHLQENGKELPTEDLFENSFNPKEISKEVYMLLSLIFDLRGLYGLTVVISLLHGKHDKNVARIPSYADIEFFGKGNTHSSDWWKELSNQLVEQDHYLEKIVVQHGSGYSYLKYQLTKKGIYFLTGITIPASSSAISKNYHHQEINYFQLKKLPFNSFYHTYQSSIHPELLKIIMAERQVKEINKNRKSCYSYTAPAYIPILDPRRNPTLLVSSSSATGQTNGITTSNNNNTVHYLLSKEKRELEKLLKDIRKLISTTFQITPYQLLTSLEIFELMDHLLPNNQLTLNRFQNEEEFMNFLKWPEWKRPHAKALVEKLQTIASLKENSSASSAEPVAATSVTNDDLDKKDSHEKTDEEQQNLSKILENCQSKSLYRPDYAKRPSPAKPIDLINTSSKKVNVPSSAMARAASFPQPKSAASAANTSFALYRPSYTLPRPTASSSLTAPVPCKTEGLSHQQPQKQSTAVTTDSTEEIPEHSASDKGDQNEDDGNDSDSTCVQVISLPPKQVEIIPIEDNGQEEETESVFDDGHLKDSPAQGKENSLNRSFSTSSTTAMLKAQRKRQFLAGFAGMKNKRKTF